MKHIYKICGKAALVFYIFTLYRLWHLCQYGGIRSHIPMLAFGIIGCAVMLILWLVSRRHDRKSETADSGKRKIYRKIFYAEILLFAMASLWFGGKIVYSAIPYHGALSWKVDEWLRKKEIKLEHNNLFQDGVNGILTDLDEALELPEELYIANKYQVTFDEK